MSSAKKDFSKLFHQVTRRDERLFGSEKNKHTNVPCEKNSMHTVLNDYNNWLAKKLISALLMNET